MKLIIFSSARYKISDAPNYNTLIVHGSTKALQYSTCKRPFGGSCDWCLVIEGSKMTLFCTCSQHNAKTGIATHFFIGA